MDQTRFPARAAIVFLAVVAAAAALKLAQGLFAPILLGLVVGVVLAPFSDRLNRAGAPPAVAALSGLVVTVALVALFVLFLEPYVSKLVRRAPLLWLEAQSVIAGLRDFLNGVEDVADSVKEALDPADSAGKAAEEGSDTGGAARAAVPDVTAALGYAPALAGQILVFVGTLFFFLLSRAELYALAARTGSRSVTAGRLFEAERLVSRYFLTITMINAVLGISVTGILIFLGMPSPILWGVLAFAVNFVPYLGPALYTAALAVAGILVFDGIQGVVPAACFMALNMVEGQFVTPALVGRNLAINPLVVFVTLTAWLWLWGPVGGIVALPLLIWLLALTGWKVGWSVGEEPPQIDALAIPETASEPDA